MPRGEIATAPDKQPAVDPETLSSIKQMLTTPNADTAMQGVGLARSPAAEALCAALLAGVRLRQERAGAEQQARAEEHGEHELDLVTTAAMTALVVFVAGTVFLLETVLRRDEASAHLSQDRLLPAAQLAMPIREFRVHLGQRVQHDRLRQVTGAGEPFRQIHWTTRPHRLGCVFDTLGFHEITHQRRSSRNIAGTRQRL